MVKLPVEKFVDYDVLPEDTIIRVIVEEIKPKEVPARDGRAGWTKLEFKFLIQDLPSELLDKGQGFHELLGTRIWGSVGMKLTTNPDNKLRQWAEALLNLGALEEGFELDTDLLVGRQARAIVSTYLRKNGGSAHQVGALLPLLPAVQGDGSVNTITRPATISPMLARDEANGLAAGTRAVPAEATSVSAGLTTQQAEVIPF